MAVRKTAKGLALKRWFKEKWRTPRGKKGYSGKDRTFRPTVRVSKDTPATWSELSKSERARAAKEKREKGRVSRYKKKKKAMKGMRVMKNGGVGDVRNVRVQSETINKTNQETNKRGKTKTRSEFTEKTKNTDLDTGEVITMDTRQVDKGKRRRPSAKAKTKSKFKQVVKISDKEGKLLAKQKDRNKRSRVRVTRAGREAGFAKGGRTQKMPKKFSVKSGDKSAAGGLTAKGVKRYRAANPGSKLKTAVTTKPSKLKPGSKAAKRRKSFCARMSGMPGPMKKPNGKPTRKALALRKWNC